MNKSISRLYSVGTVLTNKPKLERKKKKKNLKYMIRATDKGSFFLTEPWRGSKIGVNCYWEPKKWPTKKWLSGRNQGM